MLIEVGFKGILNYCTYVFFSFGRFQIWKFINLMTSCYFVMMKACVDSCRLLINFHSISLKLSHAFMYVTCILVSPSWISLSSLCIFPAGHQLIQLIGFPRRLNYQYLGGKSYNPIELILFADSPQGKSLVAMSPWLNQFYIVSIDPWLNQFHIISKLWWMKAIQHKG